MTSVDDLSTGDVVWTALDRVVGHEQSGHRPVVVVAANEYLRVVEGLAIIVPVTTRERGWSNHVRLRGELDLPEASWAMTEQVLTLSRRRFTRSAGFLDRDCLREIQLYLRDFLGL